MNEQEVLRLMGSAGAILTGGHFVYTSGKHGNTYINKDGIYPHTKIISAICGEMVKCVADQDFGIQAVVGPALGGIILSQRFAEFASARFGREILAVFAEKTPEGGFVIKRGQDKLIAGKKIVVVEDVLTTGGSVKKVVEEARTCGAIVMAVVAICNRGGVTREMVGDVPALYSLLNIKMDAYEAKVCPLCREERPINTDVGKGREFLSKLSGLHTL